MLKIYTNIIRTATCQLQLGSENLQPGEKPNLIDKSGQPKEISIIPIIITLVFRITFGFVLPLQSKLKDGNNRVARRLFMK